ncbi:unnamed protein product [Cylicostephanus goldi]|uniref:TLC domain-containing protein n=1 Tax=Cylicostephanus goldi TaxID=71465 RepID=A0A3P6S039_CYLGO|nr:unnamed protein product [Cylicostephanus goldi]
MWDFWDEYIWLGENTSWSDMASTNISYPQVTDLRYTIVFGFALLVIRVLLESLVFLPVGWIGGWISSPLLPQILSHLFGKSATSKFIRHWSVNMVRVGTLILFTHDTADILLEAMRMARYAMWLKARDIIFLIFFAVWTFTRLIYYPFWILRSVLFDAPELLQVV